MMGSTIIWLLLSFSCCIVMFPPIYSDKEIVKDGNMMDWYNLQFVAAHIIELAGLNWELVSQSHVQTCGVLGKEVDYWFITNDVNLNTTFSDVIHVDVEAELTLCDDPSSGKDVMCYSNYFEVYIYQGKYKLSFISEIPPRVNIDDLVHDFDSIYNITNHTSSNATLNRSTQTFSFYKNNSQDVTFLVRSRGACGKIFRMKMYYYYCEETFINGIKFDRTSSPLNGSNIVPGYCSNNSSLDVPKNNVTRLINPRRYCYDNGTWSLPLDGNLTCSCDEGFAPNKTDGSCSFCLSTSYKQNISNDDCIQCPNNAIGNMARTSCICEKGYYNLSSDVTLSPCYAFPVVKKLSTRLSSANSVRISWTRPNNSPNESILYDVECLICHQTANQTRNQAVNQTINQTGNQTMNQICNETINQICNEETVGNQTINQICNTSCTNEQYDPTQKDLNQTSVTVSNLSTGETYVFRVHAKNSLNDVVSMKDWEYAETDPVIVNLSVTDTTMKPSVPDSTEDNNLLLYYIIIAIAGLLLLIFIVFLIIFVIRRKDHGRNRSSNGYVNEGVELPDAGPRLYVDPSTYDDPEAAVLEFANELDPNLIFLERRIGGGEFGDVYKGELTLNNKKKMPVAVKKLKHDGDQKSARDFLLEASVMGQFDDPNVVRMEGVITNSNPRMIVLEYMPNGSLDNYLKSNDSMLTSLQLIGMARGVAAGMKYLAEIRFVHRDLAARNILVNEHLFCKIADFGLSRELETNDTSRGEYSTSGGKIPVRWTAPEAIKFRKFSTASDVWSFGVLIWEIMSFAERPYWEWDNFKVLENIDEGYRLPPPQNCPKGIHDLMLQCWKTERSERPGFAQITIAIDRWIRSPETMDDEIISLTLIGEWLVSLKMNNYENKFLDAGYKRESEITELTDEDLKKIGVTLIGHRNKIMKGINDLKSKTKTDSLPV